MKRLNVLSTLAIIAALCGWMAALPHSAAAQGAAAQQASPFKDRAEYDAYNAILQAKDSDAQLAAADKYLAAYPQSKLLENVYGIKLQAYQKANNIPKVEETANKLLEINPKHILALYLLSSIFPQTYNPQDAAAEQKLTAASDHAKAGLEVLAALAKPANVSDDDFKKQKDQLEAGFHKTAGFVALQKKDYPTAQQELHKAVEMDPNDAAGYYQLGIANLSPKPGKYDDGIWALARSLSISGTTALPPATKDQVKTYLGKVYEGVHGSPDGLTEVLAQAGTAPFPPQGFHIKTVEEIPPEPAPAPAPEAKRELSVKPEELSDWTAIQKYLTAGGQKAEDSWTILKGQSLPLPGKVVSATPAARPKTILLAVAPELAKEEGRYDVEVTLATPYSKPLAKGDQITCEGTVDSYRPKPFLVRLTDAKITK
jgi:tetratricopeptide (TPR) repeat protein